MKRLTLSSLLLLLAVPAHGVVVASYSSGVVAASGNAGAADPATQGWTFTGATPANQFAAGYDSGDGGWRTVDGTSSGPANYSQTIAAPALTALTTDPVWTMQWTVALDKDAIGSSGGFVGNYYLAPNNSRQNNLVALIDLAADGLGYYISLKVNGANQLVIEDTSGTTTQYNTGVDVSAFPNFGTFSLTHDRNTNTGLLDYGAGTVSITPGSPLVGGRNAVFFGASDSGGQGSAVWNEFSLTTAPEPSVTLLGALGALALLRRRR